MSATLKIEPYLILATNRSIYRSGENVEVVQRWLSTSGSSTDMRPPVPTWLSSDVLAANVFDVHLSLESRIAPTRFLNDEAALHVGIIVTTGLPSGSYLLQAFSGEKSERVEAEHSLLILDDAEYDQYWRDLAEEKVIDPEMIDFPEDLVAALRACASSEMFKRQLAAGEVGLNSVQMTDLRKTDMLGPLPPLSRTVFDWVHTHLLTAAYEMAFGGGILSIGLTVLDDAVETQISVRQDQTDLAHGWPSYLKYVETGSGAAINFQHISDNWHAVECRLSYHNPFAGSPGETHEPPAAAAGAPAPATS